MKKQINFAVLSVTLILSLIYLIYTLVSSSDISTNLGNIIGAFILSLFTITFVMVYFSSINKKDESKNNTILPIASLLLSVFIAFNLLTSLNIISLPKEETLDSFINESITKVIDWGSKNNIKIEQIFEDSDIVPKNHIIRQDIKEGTLLKSVKSIEIVISSGPNYDKTVIVPSMFGWNSEEVIEFIKSNHLNNVEIEYVLSAEKKDTVIEQDSSGEIRRSDKIIIKFSLGSEEELSTVKMINLKNKSLFDSTFWLKRNGLKYEINYEFNTKVDRNYVINQDKDVDMDLNPREDKVVLSISKGKEIAVPDILNMKIEDITKWIVENNLKITFENRYDDKVPIGGIIESNKKKDDIVEEETTILIVTSKGQLRMGKFDSLVNFKQWANQYNIKYEEVHEYNDTVSQGGIISFSHQENATIKNGDSIVVKISLGKPVSIQNFIGKTRSQAQSLCNSIGIKCAFVYGTYTNSNKDVVYEQSKGINTQFTLGSTITLKLSLGIPVTKKLYILENWLVMGSADSTINSLRSKFATEFPGVTFSFVKKARDGWNNGMIHDGSPTNDGSMVKQGLTYTIWIVSN